MSALRRMRTRNKVFLGLALYLVLLVALGVAYGSAGRNNDYQPQNEFKLDPWIKIKIGSLDLSINKAVLYLFIACALTAWIMIYIARRMQQRPNRVQTAVEATFDLTYNTITRGNMSRSMATKWFPFCATLFFFIWISNLVGYLPLPVNSLEKVDVFGVKLPAFQVYAATANIGVTLALSLVVWVSYNVEGIRAKGFRGYFKSWIPAGVESRAFRGFLFGIEFISHFVRIISLSVRLFANMLAGHLLILFMGGGLVVLLGIAALGLITIPVAIVFFVFEIVLIATLQAFIFSILTAIYLGEATAEHH
jgi:F-type H+-transporting ATPase subunit a